ncbi:MAG: hypothetical protein WD003_02670 [Candidatus Paceibacterota bacterium]
MLYNQKIKQYLIIAFTIALFGIIAGYTYNRASVLIHGPRISIETPKNGATVGRELLTIQGYAYNTSAITLNDNKIFVDENGLLREQILLAEGYNVITLAAQDRFGRTTQQTLELVYKK